MSLISLPEVVYDCRARDGTWCAKPSRDYPKGCPNFPKCPQRYINFKKIDEGFGPFKWFAVIEEFDITGWEASQREKHKGENWSRKQLRNPRHWQKGVMKRLREKALNNVNFLMRDVLLEIPEAHGVDVVRTMAKVGVTFEWGLQAKTIRKVMLIGKKEEEYRIYHGKRRNEGYYQPGDPNYKEE